MTRVRVSLLVPVVVVLLMVWFRDIRMGLTAGGVLFASILIHEFAHVFAARMTGGYADEILMWPLGGLAFANAGRSMRSRILTPLAGPLSNLAVCVCVLAPVVHSGKFAAAINPHTYTLHSLQLDSLGLESLCILVFVVNWLGVLLNLVPVYPLDGGQVLRVLLATRLGSRTATDISLRVGVAMGVLGLIGGLFLDSSAVVAVGAVVLLLNRQESIRFQLEDVYDDSFMGYDFSQGYTSLEQSAGGKPEAVPSMLQRWRERRRLEKDQREQARAEEESQQVDQILQKLHESGDTSLTDSERRILKNASDRLRNREQGNH